MPNTVLSLSSRPEEGFASTKLVVGIVLAVWFALVMALGAAGRFVTPSGTPPFPIAIGAGVPIVVFLAGLWISRPFREFVLAADIRVLLGIQAWRFAGLGFLALYTYDVLPGSFALPAGLGDMAIGVTAPWMLLSIIREPRFAASKTFVVWNGLGLLDLVSAITTGALGSVLATGIAGEVTTGPMARLPLVLIPAYVVPILFMLHIAALMQARRLARDSTRAM